MDKQLSLFALAASTIDASPKKESVKPWNVYIDGAARGNPGPAGIGIYVTDGTKTIIKHGFYLGKKTNNQAEYLALAVAVFLIKKEYTEKKIDCPTLHFFSDSELLIKQMNKFYKVKNAVLLQIKSMIEGMLVGSKHSFKHVFREANTIADELANHGIDKKNKLPTDFLKFLANCSLII